MTKKRTKTTNTSGRISFQDCRELLENVRRSGTELSARCPAHADSTNSLTFREKEGGVVFKCQSGCDHSAIINAIKRLRKERGSDRIDSEAAESAEADTQEESIPPAKWNERAKQFVSQLSDVQCKAFAKQLGVLPRTIRLLGCGWHPVQECYTIPERNADGDCIGISLRYPDGAKKMIQGSKRGLTMAFDTDVAPERPILIPEGASDVAACLSMGFTALGRPSATGGVAILADMLRELPAERAIIVVGEMDAKRDGRWPGKDGAVKVATELANQLRRSIIVIFPPAGKDLREYLGQRSKGTKMADRGTELLEQLEANEDKLQVVEPVKDEYELTVISAGELLDQKIELQWGVEQVMVRGQPMIFGGPKKALKTTIAVDLAISLATGHPFLGKFRVPTPLRVCLLSGESGQATLQETIRRQIFSKGLTKQDLQRLTIGFRLPRLSNEESLARLAQLLEEQQVEVLIIDPLYLCLLSGNTEAQASNLFDMGPLLLKVAELCTQRNVTPVFLHHFPKGRGSKNFGIPELDDLAFAGIAEFARQWLLLGRRSAFNPGSGHHELWMNVGGSVGFSNYWGVDVDEGTLDLNFSGRTWEVTARPGHEIEVGEKGKSKSPKARTEDEWKVLQYLFGPGKKGDTQSGIRDGVKVSKQNIAVLLSKMLNQDWIRACKVTKSAGGAGSRAYDGFKLTTKGQGQYLKESIRRNKAVG